MDKTLQDKAWGSLPAEFLKKVREILNRKYSEWERCPNECSEGIYCAIQSVFNSLFGEHNLTSDTEPEEMLCVKRSDIQELFHNIGVALTNVSLIEGDQSYNCNNYNMIMERLKSLFDTKCLPDATSKKIDAADDCIDIAKSEIGITDPTPEQPEPKLKVEQLVKLHNLGEEKATISEIYERETCWQYEVREFDSILRYLAKEISQAVESTKETDYTNDGYRLDIDGYGPIYITPGELEALKELQTI